VQCSENNDHNSPCLARITKRSSLFHLLDIAHLVFQKKSKTHDYTHQECGLDYMFESVDQGMHAYMTGQGKGISQGDHIILQSEQDTQCYRVEAVDYYACPSEMWIALLSQVSNHPQS
jgi:hypothetical protein